MLEEKINYFGHKIGLSIGALSLALVMTTGAQGCVEFREASGSYKEYKYPLGSNEWKKCKCGSDYDCTRGDLPGQSSRYPHCDGCFCECEPGSCGGGEKCQLGKCEEKFISDYAK
ncbi:MAG: hypothetical protein V2A62_01245 [Candidatus Woesearchaeota archaeon]